MKYAQFVPFLTAAVGTKAVVRYSVYVYEK